MAIPRKRPAFGVVIYFAVTLSLGLYFTFAAVQGDYGLFRRVEINAEADELRAEKARLIAEVHELRNKTHRISDDYLDLDLLDQQARDVLGLVRADEVVIR
ncbi:septum formation initiator family protein [Vannielia sp.]|uniref:FtsB family cell division protein n=1 Tax=Vannielia sp. TaxID=2813045 RepID=UPI00260E7124|nr:septum formation initiator family protein [Vannielia sp.]MDF1873015.1 septum formation initiator family protein [Vannielia sp.]